MLAARRLIEPVIEPETPRTATSSAAETATTATDASARPQCARSSRALMALKRLKEANCTVLQNVCCRLPERPGIGLGGHVEFEVLDHVGHRLGERFVRVPPCAGLLLRQYVGR